MIVQNPMFKLFFEKQIHSESPFPIAIYRQNLANFFNLAIAFYRVIEHVHQYGFGYQS